MIYIEPGLMPAPEPGSERPLNVVQLAPEEWPRLRSIRLRALLDAPDAFSSTFGEAFSRSPEGWSKQLLDMPTFIAVKDGLDVGVVRCARDDPRGTTAWLISMWVAPEARSRGIGRTLVDTVIHWARTNGVERVLLDVADDNGPAIGLYARKGFIPSGEVGTFPPPRQHIREHRRELRLT